jgi:hypothetical protein
VDVTVLELPIDIPKFNIAQYWHERFHTDPGNRWLRGVFARLYGRQSVPEPCAVPATESIEA